MDLIAKIIGLYPLFRNVLRDDQNTALTNNWIVRRVQILIMDRIRLYSTYCRRLVFHLSRRLVTRRINNPKVKIRELNFSFRR